MSPLDISTSVAFAALHGALCTPDASSWVEPATRCRHVLNKGRRCKKPCYGKQNKIDDAIAELAKLSRVDYTHRFYGPVARLIELLHCHLHYRGALKHLETWWDNKLGEAREAETSNMLASQALSQTYSSGTLLISPDSPSDPEDMGYVDDGILDYDAKSNSFGGLENYNQDGELLELPIARLSTPTPMTPRRRSALGSSPSSSLLDPARINAATSDDAPTTSPEGRPQGLDKSSSLGSQSPSSAMTSPSSPPSVRPNESSRSPPRTSPRTPTTPTTPTSAATGGWDVEDDTPIKARTTRTSERLQAAQRRAHANTKTCTRCGAHDTPSDTPIPIGRTNPTEGVIDHEHLGKIILPPAPDIQLSRGDLISKIEASFNKTDDTEGIVYVFQHKSNASFCKVGWTAGSTKDRVANESCDTFKRDSKWVYESEKAYVGSHRAETLILNDIKRYRVKFVRCKGCGKRPKEHQEWFYVDCQQLVSRVKAWEEFVQSGIYAKGEISQFGIKLLHDVTDVGRMLERADQLPAAVAPHPPLSLAAISQQNTIMVGTLAVVRRPREDSRRVHGPKVPGERGAGAATNQPKTKATLVRRSIDIIETRSGRLVTDQIALISKDENKTSVIISEERTLGRRDTLPRDFITSGATPALARKDGNTKLKTALKAVVNSVKGKRAALSNEPAEESSADDISITLRGRALAEETTIRISPKRLLHAILRANEGKKDELPGHRTGLKRMTRSWSFR